MTNVRTGMVTSIALTLSFLLTSCQDPSPDKASLKYSEDLYDGCVQCHGENGEGNQDLGAPAIAGLERWYIKAQLRKFKKSQRGWHLDDMAGKRMQPMALALDTDEKVDLVAAYVASLPRTNPAPTPRRRQSRNGQDLLCHLRAVPRCRCPREPRRVWSAIGRSK